MSLLQTWPVARDYEGGNVPRPWKARAAGQDNNQDNDL